MRITWVTRSFLDYRIPVFAALDELCGHELTVIYNAEVVPDRCIKRLQGILGARNVALTGEKRISGENNAPISTTRRKGIRIPFQPGLIEAIKESHPDVIVSDGFFQWTYAAFWMRIFHHVPHVMCYEPTKHTERNTQWYRTLYRRLASHWIDAICCNGILCKEYCMDVLHIPESKLSTGQMAADTQQLAQKCQNISEEERQAFRREHNLHGLVFLYVGRIVELKGLRQLLEAWKQAHLNNATLLCVGDGPQLEELRVFSENENLQVIFAGNMDHSHIALAYRSADVFVIPTLQDNWSLVVPEAMACGLPIMCSCYNGCYPELVTRENGWVFDSMETQATAETLRAINIKTQEELKNMGHNSRRIVSDFSPAIAAKAIFKGCQTAIMLRGGKIK